jgi:hypothetical protein
VLYLLLDNYEIAYIAKPGELDSYGRQKQDVIKGATVYRSDNAGASWKQVSGLTEETKVYMERHSGTYGWVFGQIRIDPKDENTIYTLGIQLHQSVDGGATFKILMGPHADHHGLWIDPNNPNYILNVQDGGLTISYDKGPRGNIRLMCFLLHSSTTSHMTSACHSGSSVPFRIITVFTAALTFHVDATG